MKLLSWVLVVSVVGGCGGKPIVERSNACDLPDLFALLCPLATCGSNSPEVNAFPFNGLHWQGCHNSEGAYLVPGTLRKGSSICTESGDFTLGVRSDASGGYKIVALKGDKEVCPGELLAGMTFDVHQKGATTTLLIAHVARSPDDLVHPKTPERTLYFISQPATPEDSLCTYSLVKSPTAIHGVLSAASPQALKRIQREEISEYAVIVPGVVYDKLGRPIRKSDLPGWFNIACASDALGQSELSGLLDKPPSAGQVYDRQTVLNMFAAKYKDGRSATVRGMPIAWTDGDRRSNFDVATHPHESIQTLKKEAEWNADGALCISHSRMWMTNRVVPWLDHLVAGGGNTVDPPTPAYKKEANLVELFGKPPCSEKQKEGVLTTYVLEHVDE